MLYIRQDISSIYSHGADIRTVSQDASKPVRTLSIRIVKEGYQELTNKNIVVILPNVRKPIPLFIVMRALGIISDKNIIIYPKDSKGNSTDAYKAAKEFQELGISIVIGPIFYESLEEIKDFINELLLMP